VLPSAQDIEWIQYVPEPLYETGWKFEVSLSSLSIETNITARDTGNAALESPSTLRKKPTSCSTTVVSTRGVYSLWQRLAASIPIEEKQNSTISTADRTTDVFVFGDTSTIATWTKAPDWQQIDSQGQMSFKDTYMPADTTTLAIGLNRRYSWYLSGTISFIVVQSRSQQLSGS
jgi:hypothetical protein